MVKKFSGLSRRRTRPGKSRLGQRPAVRTLKERMDAAIAKAKGKATAKAKAEKPTSFTKAAIEAKIDKLREKEKWSFRERHKKTDFYQYLKGVYGLRRWAKRRAKQIAALYDIQVRKDKTPIRIIIDASCDQDRQVKSCWTLALQYALARKVRRSDFVEFLRANGGPAGCEAKLAALKKEKAKKHGW